MSPFNYMYILTNNTCTTYPLLEEVLVHFSHVSVSMSVYRASMDVEAIQPPGHDKHTDVTDGAEVHKLTNLVLKESLVDQEDKETLQRNGIW